MLGGLQGQLGPDVGVGLAPRAAAGFRPVVGEVVRDILGLARHQTLLAHRADTVASQAKGHVGDRYDRSIWTPAIGQLHPEARERDVIQSCEGIGHMRSEPRLAAGDKACRGGGPLQGLACNLGWFEGDLGREAGPDLRRSFATNACDVLQIDPAVADRCLNHVGASTTSTISRVYGRNEMFEQRRDALRKWSAFFGETVANGQTPSAS